MSFNVTVFFMVRSRPQEVVSTFDGIIAGAVSPAAAVQALVGHLWNDPPHEGVTVAPRSASGRVHNPVKGDVFRVCAEGSPDEWFVARGTNAEPMPYSAERYATDHAMFNTMTRGTHITPQAVDFWVEVANGRV